MCLRKSFLSITETPECHARLPKTSGPYGYGCDAGKVQSPLSSKLLAEALGWLLRRSVVVPVLKWILLDKSKTSAHESKIRKNFQSIKVSKQQRYFGPYKASYKKDFQLGTHPRPILDSERKPASSLESFSGGKNHPYEMSSKLFTDNIQKSVRVGYEK